ncbi:DUF6660 family protein [Sphingobacterium sp. Mn56C]|uniref:DUF6660 family protein n=1 Tax=Sphingobacterium sp. Mn56C TaxID=3395261 RepID=UPI003BC6D963
MKWFTLILTVYLSALFLVPCSDASNRCSENTMVGQLAQLQQLQPPEQLEQQQQQQHQHQDDRDDHCSPFCSCSCCGVTIQQGIFKYIEFKTPVQVFKITKLCMPDFSVPTTYNTSIWQPPRV